MNIRRPHLPSARQGHELPRGWYLRLLVWILRLVGFKFITLSQALAAPFGRYVCLTFDCESADLAQQLLPALVKHHMTGTVFVTTRGQEGLKVARLLQQAGWEIGCIGHALVDLTTQGLQEQRRLITKAKSLLTTKLGLTPAIFAYPFGAYDATTVSCIKDEGFTAAVTLRSGLNDESIEPHHLRRLTLAGKLFTDLRHIAQVLLINKRQAKLNATPSSDGEVGRQSIAL